MRALCSRRSWGCGTIPRALALGAVVPPVLTFFGGWGTLLILSLQPRLTPPVVQHVVSPWIHIAQVSLTVAALVFALLLLRRLSRRNRALLETQRSYATLLANLPGMAYRCQNNRDWTMEFVSDGCLELTGYWPSDLLHDRKVAYADLILPDDADAVWNDVQTAVSKRRPFQLVYRIKTAEGEVKWVWEQGRGVFSDGGDLLALEGFITDITAQKLAQEALRRERDRAQMYLEEAGVLIVAIDQDQKVTLLNKIACGILGYDSKEAVGENWFDTFVPERIRGEVKAVFAKLMAGEIAPVEYFENPVLTKRGEERTIAWHNTVLTDESGTIIGTLSHGEDVTAQRGTDAEPRRREG